MVAIAFSQKRMELITSDDGGALVIWHLKNKDTLPNNKKVRWCILVAFAVQRSDVQRLLVNESVRLVKIIYRVHRHTMFFVLHVP